MGRINLLIPDDMYAACVREAKKAGISPASYARESLSWRLGRAEADELRDRIAALEAAEHARLRERG